MLLNMVLTNEYLLKGEHIVTTVSLIVVWYSGKHNIDNNKITNYQL